MREISNIIESHIIILFLETRWVYLGSFGFSTLRVFLRYASYVGARKSPTKILLNLTNGLNRLFLFLNFLTSVKNYHYDIYDYNIMSYKSGTKYNITITRCVSDGQIIIL